MSLMGIEDGGKEGNGNTDKTLSVRSQRCSARSEQGAAFIRNTEPMLLGWLRLPFR